MRDIVITIFSELDKTDEGKQLLEKLKDENSIIQIEKMMLIGKALLASARLLKELRDEQLKSI